jgi:hypothetical protein
MVQNIRIMLERILYWLFSSVILSLIPLAFSYLGIYLGGTSPTKNLILSHGELTLISAGIAGAAISEVIGSGKRLRTNKIIAGISCVVALCLASFMFAWVSSGNSTDPESVSNGSIFIFVFTLIASGSCAVLAERGR